LKERSFFAGRKLAESARGFCVFSKASGGERNISLFNIESLARALRVKMAELMPDWRPAPRSRTAGA
jgi:hypothetical protein